jgi:hypothetical protein
MVDATLVWTAVGSVAGVVAVAVAVRVAAAQTQSARKRPPLTSAEPVRVLVVSPGGDAAVAAATAPRAATGVAAASLAVPLGRRDERTPLRGRDELVDALVTAAPESSPRVQVLCGLGGCGKTSIALEAAARLTESGIEAWWVVASDADGFDRSMLALARRLGLTEEQTRRSDLADLVWQKLVAHAKPWLLVLDNADDLSVLEIAGGRLSDGTGWLRPLSSPKGLAVVTSRHGRDADWGTWSRVHHVRMLDPEIAAQVLIDHAGKDAGSADAATALAVRLGGLPLALRIAGSSLAEARSTPEIFTGSETLRGFTQYTSALEEGRYELAYPVPEDVMSGGQAREVIVRTWGLSLDLLERRGQGNSRVLLTLLACLADAPIPYELVLNPALLAASPLLSEGITGKQVWGGLQALEGVGLIELLTEPSSDEGGAPTTGVVQLHPVVRDTSRPVDGSPETRAYVALAANLVERAVVGGVMGSPKDSHRREWWRLLEPHVFHLLDTVGDGPDLEVVRLAAEAGHRAARYLGATGAYGRAEAKYRAVLAARERALGADHPDTLDTRHRIAWTVGAQGGYGEAEADYRAVLAARERVLGADHPDTLAPLHDIGWTVGAQGRYGEAEADYRAVLAARERVLGADHPDTLDTRHWIAWTVGAQGRYGEAEADYRAVLAARERVLGPDHPDTRQTRRQLQQLRKRRAKG